MAAENTPQFNVLKHELVPEHRLLSEEEAKERLAELNITADKLPKIRQSDITIKVLEKVHGETITAGRVIEIKRKSDTAKVFVAYRVVTGN